MFIFYEFRPFFVQITCALSIFYTTVVQPVDHQVVLCDPHYICCKNYAKN